MKRLPFLALISLIFLSCTKEGSSEFTPDPGSPYNDTAWSQAVAPGAPVNGIFQLFSKPAQTNSFPAGTGGMVPFDNGILISFPQNACPGVTGGDIDVAVDYLKTKGDLIRFGRPATSGDALLVSGGAFNVTVTQNGNLLQLAEGKTISIRYPVATPGEDMRVFYGDTSVNSREGFTWVQSTDPTSAVTPVETDTATFNQLICTKFGWVNCDKFFNNGGDRTKVSVILHINFTNNNTAVFFVSTTAFMVARCRTDAGNRLFFLENMPVGNDFEIVTISKIGEDLYLGTKQVTLSKDMVTELSPEKKSEQEISDFLDGL